MERTIDIEDLDKKANHILSRDFPAPQEQDYEKFYPMIKDILSRKEPLTASQFATLRRKYKFNGRHSFLFKIYLELLKRDKLVYSKESESILRRSLQVKPCKSWSGIVSVTVFTSPYPEYTIKDENGQDQVIVQSFSCAYNCSYCPNEPGQPRSYLKMEPGVLRANRNNFICTDQMWDRMNGLYLTGHLERCNKLEVIVSGGTWTSYPHQYREEFCRDVFYAANTFWDNEKRPKKTLDEEKEINCNAECRVVGLTIETRPDTINNEELRRLRYYGVTRVQLGIQHVDDYILNINNRKCATAVTIKAIELLKRNCFKIDAHWMPNLPGSSLEKDKHLFIDILLGLNGHVKRTENSQQMTEEWELTYPEFSVDQWKVYPTAITPYTDIEKWFKAGSYVQYDENDMIDLLIRTKMLMFPWIRLNRIIRDIPKDYMYNENTGSDNTSLRADLCSIMKKEGTKCCCIRCREVKNANWNDNWKLVIRRYNASHGCEYYISAELSDMTLYGFVRLRLDDARDKAFPELNGCALIRELHVYGQFSQFYQNGQNHIQHKGIGKMLMAKAEAIAKEHTYRKIAVIASEGTKEYYRKIGYSDMGMFLVKVLINI